MDNERLRREHEESVDVFYRERENDLSFLKGLAIGIALISLFAYLVFRIMQWYLSTMPPLRFH